MYLKKAFTLAEIMVVLTLLGIVAAITIPSTLKRAQNRLFVTKLLKNYSALENATSQWMVEEGCVGDIRICFAALRRKGLSLNTTQIAFRGISDRLNISATSVGNDIPSWLTNEPATLLNGAKQSQSWQAASSKINDNSGAWYLLKDGSVLFVQFPDNEYQSAFGFIDVNGKKGPNRVGKDIFELGWGAQGNSNMQYQRGLHPYFAEDQWVSADKGSPDENGEIKPCNGGYYKKDSPEYINGCGINWNDGGRQPIGNGKFRSYYVGLCRVSCTNCECEADEHSPTAFVLKNKKLPNLKNIGYPD